MKREDKRCRKQKTSSGERQKISQGDNEKKFQNSCTVSLQNYQSRQEWGTQGFMQIVHPPQKKKETEKILCVCL